VKNIQKNRKMDPTEKAGYQACLIGTAIAIFSDIFVIYLLTESGEIVWNPFQNIAMGYLAFSIYAIPKLVITTKQYRRQFT
jgi:hypothetical protein